MSAPTRIALFGGVYSNHVALRAALEDMRGRQVDQVHFLGDLGGFGPSPDKSFPLLEEHRVQAIQGNYDHSLGNGLDNCACGYSDPRDNHFAQISYDYTFEHTSPAHKEWLAGLPPSRKLELGRYRVHLCHGSPRRTNEFLWESATPGSLLEHFLASEQADVLCFTHTGIRWHLPLPGDRHAINVGVLGRPENNGGTQVWYALLSALPDFSLEWIPVTYDHAAVEREILEQGLPAEFAETLRTGWWTTCLENMPSRERSRGPH